MSEYALVLQSSCTGTFHLHHLPTSDFHKEQQGKYSINNYSISSDPVALVIKQHPTLLGSVQEQNKIFLLPQGFAI